MPFVFKHVAVMPDCHYGKGATVGTVLATQCALIPAAENARSTERAGEATLESDRVTVRSRLARLHNVSKPRGETGGVEWTAENEKGHATACGSSA